MTQGEGLLEEPHTSPALMAKYLFINLFDGRSRKQADLESLFGILYREVRRAFLNSPV